MQKISATAVVLAAAGTAWATPVLGDYSTYTQISADNVTAVALGDVFTDNTRGASDTPVYSNLDPNVASGQYSAFAAAPGFLGFDDYTSTSATPFELTSFNFVGGNVNAGQVMNVEFYNDAGDTLLDAFSVTLASGGNFIYTITLGAGFNIEASGIVQLVSDDLLGGGQWFLSDAPTTVGSDNLSVGSLPDSGLSHNFALNTPAPGAFALLGLGGLVATRRRR